MAVNTSKSLKENAKETAEKDLQKQVEQAAATLKAEKLVKVSIPKSFEKFVGPTVPFGINGVMIVLPVDGQDYEVPAPYKQLVKDFIDSVQM
jgi:predicted secreted protein